MRVRVQVLRHLAIVSEFTAPWAKFARDAFASVASTWEVPYVDLDVHSERGGLDGLTVRVLEASSGRLIYEAGILEFGPWNMEYDEMWFLESACSLCYDWTEALVLCCSMSTAKS